MMRRKEPREVGWGQERGERGTGRARALSIIPGLFQGHRAPRAGFPLVLPDFISLFGHFCPGFLLPGPWGARWLWGSGESPGAAGTRSLQYRESAADGDLYPALRRKTEQSSGKTGKTSGKTGKTNGKKSGKTGKNQEKQRLPPGCQPHPAGLGPGADGGRRCRGSGWVQAAGEGREEPQGSAPEPDFPTGRVGGSRERTSDGEKGERV